ncbi:MAG: hypothetical protein AAF617_12645 [Bacteroidota bacterium]
MKLRINRWVFFAVIFSSFFIMIYGRHVGGPCILFELLIFFNLPDIIRDADLFTIIYFLSIVTGQVLFLYLGWRTVTRYKAVLLLLSPVFVITPMMMMILDLDEFQKQTLMTTIPFFIAICIFYASCIFQLCIPQKKSANLHEKKT